MQGAPFGRPGVFFGKRQLGCRMHWQSLFRSGSPDNVLVGLAGTRIRVPMLVQALNEIGERIPDTVAMG
jgi:hypothetical protein